MNLLPFIILFFCILIVSGGIFYLLEERSFHKPNRVVYMSSSSKEIKQSLKEIIQKYIIQKGYQTSDYTVIEPGAGFAFISEWLLSQYAWKSAQAIELRNSIVLLARFRLWLKRVTLLKFSKQDIFEMELQGLTCMYCYLTTPIITRLYNEGKMKNCLVVCVTFQIETVTCTEMIPLKNWQKAIYVYDFRTA